MVMLKENVKASFSFPGGFGKKMERVWMGGMAKARPQSVRVAGWSCVTGCSINGNVWPTWAGAGHAGERRGDRCVWDGSV